MFHRWALALGTIRHINEANRYWIRVKGLPLHLWTTSQLEGIVKVCGGMVEIDPLTVEQRDYRWARLKVGLVELGSIPQRVRVWDQDQGFSVVVVVENDLEDERLSLVEWCQEKLPLMEKMVVQPKPLLTIAPGFRKQDDEYGSGFVDLNSNFELNKEYSFLEERDCVDTCPSNLGIENSAFIPPFRNIPKLRAKKASGNLSTKTP